MKVQQEVKNGVVVRDVVTGFVGRVTGIVHYWTGCDQALIVPPVDDRGKRMEGEWIDIQRLRVLEAAIDLPNPSLGAVGFDQAPPQR